MDDKKTFGGFEILAWLCAAVAFSPALVWLYSGLTQSQQLRDAMIIMLSALGVLAIEHKISPHKPVFSKKAAIFLGLAYTLIICSHILGEWKAVAILGGLALAIVAAGLACFDKPRYVYAAGGAFYAFTLLSFVLKGFDLPLRVLAGIAAHKILALFGIASEVLTTGGLTPQIAMRSGGQTFLVATECNGFGIISSCIVLSIALAIFASGTSWLRRLAIPLIAAVIGFVANALRIACIVATAPHFAHERYDLIHEFWGYAFFAAALVLVWKFARKNSTHKKSEVPNLH